MRGLLQLLKWLPACDFGIRLIYVYFRPGEKIATSALGAFVGMVFLIGGAEYAWIRKIDRFQGVLKAIIRNAPSLVFCTLVAVVLLETHASAFYYGISYKGPGANVVEFLTADPYYLGEKHDMQIAGKKEHAHDPEESEVGEPAIRAEGEPEEKKWDAEAYKLFFHCTPDSQLDVYDLKVAWRAILDRQRSEQHVSDYHPDKLEVEETDAIHEIAEGESRNRTVADWLAQCKAHEALYEKYQSTTFSYFASNDYHNLLQCGINHNAPVDELLLWYSRAVHYRLEYLSFEDAADSGQVIRWIAMRYKEIADDPERYGETVSAHAQVNADVLFELVQEY